MRASVPKGTHKPKNDRQRVPSFKAGWEARAGSLRPRISFSRGRRILLEQPGRRWVHVWQTDKYGGFLRRTLDSRRSGLPIPPNIRQLSLTEVRIYMVVNTVR
jgi:hypothetical protein